VTMPVMTWLLISGVLLGTCAAEVGAAQGKVFELKGGDEMGGEWPSTQDVKLLFEIVLEGPMTQAQVQEVQEKLNELVQILPGQGKVTRKI